jgi:hypothetical protein
MLREFGVTVQMNLSVTKYQDVMERNYLGSDKTQYLPALRAAGSVNVIQLNFNIGQR